MDINSKPTVNIDGSNISITTVIAGVVRLIMYKTTFLNFQTSGTNIRSSMTIVASRAKLIMVISTIPRNALYRYT